MFVGDHELTQVLIQTGYIAQNHDRVGGMLNYLIGHLEIFALSRTKRWRDLSCLDLERRAFGHMNERCERIGFISVTDLSVKVEQCLLDKSIVVTLADEHPCIVEEWQSRTILLKDLQKARNAVVHGSVSWCAGKLIREQNMPMFGSKEIVTLEEYKELNERLVAAWSEVSAFTEKLGARLPFLAFARIFSGTANAVA